MKEALFFQVELQGRNAPKFAPESKTHFHIMLRCLFAFGPRRAKWVQCLCSSACGTFTMTVWLNSLQVHVRDREAKRDK